MSSNQINEADKEPARHFLLLIDGTSLSASRIVGHAYHSNVYNMSLYLETHNERKEPQVAFYLRGVGSEIHAKRLDRLNGKGLRGLIEQAYLNVAMNYNAGDSVSHKDLIYVFGFSRGAYVAQIVCVLIDTYGVLRPAHIAEFDAMFDHWTRRDRKSIGSIKTFKDKFCKKARIEFCGIFDSVLGRYKEDRYSGNIRRNMQKMTKLPACVKCAAHLLALDDSRSAFKPVMWSETSDPTQVMTQMWMPGGHTDVGGGYSERLLSDISLLTMLALVRHETKLKVDIDRFDERIAEVRMKLSRFQEICIHDEGGKPLWLFMRRTRTRLHRPTQFQHPILSRLNTQYVTWNGKKRRYTANMRSLSKTEAGPYCVQAIVEDVYRST